jgi:hypothetical protein
MFMGTERGGGSMQTGFVGGFFLLRESILGSVRPRPCARLAPTLATFAPPPRPLGGLQQRWHRRASSSSAGTISTDGSAVGRVSMNSRTTRPLAVIFQPPFSRSARPCEKMSRSGTRAANRLKRSAQSRQFVARIAMSRLRSAITANPSG